MGRGRAVHDSTYEQYGIRWYPQRVFYRGAVKLYYRAEISCPGCGRLKWVRKNAYVKALRDGNQPGCCQRCAKRIHNHKPAVRTPKDCLPKLINDDIFNRNINAMGTKVGRINIPYEVVI